MTPDQRATIDLRYIHRGCERFRQLDFGDGDDAVRERMALRLEWDDAIGTLPEIVEAAGKGELSAAVVQELRAVAQEVTDLLPTIRKLRNPLPDGEALDRAMAQPVVSDTR